MGYATSDARQDLLDAIASATDEIGVALAALGEAYEQLDEHNADRLEEALFRPVQSAYGRAQRTHAEFAGRHGLRGRAFAPAMRRAASRGVKGFLEDALDAVEQADEILAALQDSMKPVEVGDPDLRAGLTEVRVSLGGLSAGAREFLRLFGR